MRKCWAAALAGFLAAAAGAACAAPVGAQDPAGVQERTPPPDPVQFILALDPGHGGRDGGSRGPGPVLEKDFTLRIASLLAERLRRRPGVKVILTREGDTEISPAQRAAVANYNGASLFISIHADASWRKGARGPAVLVASPQRPPTAGGESSEAAAARWQRGQNVHLAASHRFAQGLAERFRRIRTRSRVPLRILPVRELEGAKMAAVYVSMGVISTPEEVARLKEMKIGNPYLGALEAEVARFARLPERAPEAKPGEGPPPGAGAGGPLPGGGSVPNGGSVPGGGG